VAVINLTPGFSWKRLKESGAFAVGGAEAGDRNLGLGGAGSSAPSALQRFFGQSVPDLGILEQIIDTPMIEAG